MAFLNNQHEYRQSDPQLQPIPIQADGERSPQLNKLICRCGCGCACGQDGAGDRNLSDNIDFPQLDERGSGHAGLSLDECERSINGDQGVEAHQYEIGDLGPATKSCIEYDLNRFAARFCACAGRALWRGPAADASPAEFSFLSGIAEPGSEGHSTSSSGFLLPMSACSDILYGIGAGLGEDIANQPPSSPNEDQDAFASTNVLHNSEPLFLSGDPGTFGSSGFDVHPASYDI